MVGFVVFKVNYRIALYIFHRYIFYNKALRFRNQHCLINSVAVIVNSLVAAAIHRCQIFALNYIAVFQKHRFGIYSDIPFTSAFVIIINACFIHLRIFGRKFGNLIFALYRRYFHNTVILGTVINVYILTEIIIVILIRIETHTVVYCYASIRFFLFNNTEISRTCKDSACMVEFFSLRQYLEKGFILSLDISIAFYLHRVHIKSIVNQYRGLRSGNRLRNVCGVFRHSQ